MPIDIAELENLVILIKRDKKFALARVVQHGTNGEEFYEIEFEDHILLTVSPGKDTFEIYRRYCKTAKETARCVEQQRDLASLRDKFCELNGSAPDNFARAYAFLVR
jgi:hypothetical protein